MILLLLLSAIIIIILLYWCPYWCCHMIFLSLLHYASFDACRWYYADKMPFHYAITPWLLRFIIVHDMMFRALLATLLRFAFRFRYIITLSPWYYATPLPCRHAADIIFWYYYWCYAYWYAVNMIYDNPPYYPRYYFRHAMLMMPPLHITLSDTCCCHEDAIADIITLHTRYYPPSSDMIRYPKMILLLLRCPLLLYDADIIINPWYMPWCWRDAINHAMLPYDIITMPWCCYYYYFDTSAYYWCWCYYCYYERDDIMLFRESEMRTIHYYYFHIMLLIWARYTWYWYDERYIMMSDP